MQRCFFIICVLAVVAASQPVFAGPVLQAANRANAAIDSCGKKFKEKPLEGCVADVLEKFAGDLQPTPTRAVVVSLRAAVTDIRAATNKESSVFISAGA